MIPETTVALADGRKLGVREVDAGDLLDLIEAAGKAATSDAWMNYALAVCAVRSIDGVPVMFPINKDGIRDLARRIGTDGLGVVADSIGETGSTELADSAKN